MKRVFEFDANQLYMLQFALGQFVKEQAAFVKSKKAENQAGAARRLKEAKELVEFLND